MGTEGWCVGLGQEEFGLGWVNRLKYLKSGCNKKEGRGKQRFLKRETSWVKGCVPYKEGGWNPITNYDQRLP